MTATVAVLTSSADGSYYTAALPSNYYIGQEAERGHWWGPLAETLQLKGSVGSREFANLLGGKHPGTEKRLVKDHKDRVPGIDLTFSAPKSVSAIYAVCDRETRIEIEQSQKEAVENCLKLISDHVPLFRSGRGGATVEHGQFCAALFQHLVNRNGDPSLHTHAVIPNIVRNAKGKNQAIHTRALFNYARTLGPLYRASLAQSLRSRLGLELEIPLQGTGKVATWFEVKGVPKPLLKHWSSRKSEIDEYLTPRGYSRDSASPQFRSQANNQTRRSKDKLPHIDILFDRWQQDARDHQFSASRVIHTACHSQPTPSLAQRVRSATKESVKELSADSAHFKYSDLLRSVAEKLQDVGIAPQELKAKLDRTISSSRSIIRLEGEGFEGRFTTKGLWRLEESLLKDADRLLKREGAVASNKVVNSLLEQRTTLTKEQANAIKGLIQSKESLRLLRGAAGAGKTFTLDAVREGLEKSGYKVVGGAVSGLAKETLRNEAKLETKTVAYYLKRIEHLRKPLEVGPPKRLFDSKTVLILDEASMIDLRSMQKLVQEVRRSKSTLILVGDDKQLQAIGAGGSFKYLLESLKPVTLTENKRQVNKADRQAVALVRAGKVKEALTSYLRRGCLKIEPTRKDAAQQLVQAWAKAGGTNNPKAHVIFSETRREADYLNRLCQQKRIEDGQCDPSATARIEGTVFYKGDRVLFQKADKPHGIENGFRGVITAVGQLRNSITVLLDTPKPGMPRKVTISLNLKTPSDISLGYAATTHKMQGQTTEYAYVLVGGGLSEQAMTYTQLTRGRLSTSLFVDAASAGEDLQQLANAMKRDRTKTLAHAHHQSSSLSHSNT